MLMFNDVCRFWAELPCSIWYLSKVLPHGFSHLTNKSTWLDVFSQFTSICTHQNQSVETILIDWTWHNTFGNNDILQPLFNTWYGCNKETIIFRLISCFIHSKTEKWLSIGLTPTFTLGIAFSVCWCNDNLTLKQILIYTR